MPDQNEVQPTIPEQPEAKPPLRKGAPLVLALIVIVALIGLANISSLISGNKKTAPQSALTMRPSAPNAQQVTSFETQQQIQARRDSFSLDFDKYLGLDQIGTTGLATKVDHGYLMAFGAAAAIGGLGGLTQIGNNGSVFTPSTEIRNGISEQTAAEGEQVSTLR